MGAGGASTGGGGGGVGPAGIKKDGTYGTKKDAKKTSSRNEVRKAIKEFEPLPVKIIKAITEVPKKNKKSKSGDVYGGKTPGYNEAKEKIDYKAPTTPRGDNDGGNNNTPTVKVASIPKVTTAPTKVEVDQSAATDTTAVAETKKVDDIYTRKKKSKARGRSMMTLTSAQGLKKDDNLVLGKRSLLGS